MRRAVIGLVTGLAVLGVVVATPSARAESHFSFYFGVPAPVVVAPPVVVGPAPVVVAPPAYYGDTFWQPGYYGWVGYQRRWVPGRWVRRAPRANWNGRGWNDRREFHDRGRHR